MAEIQLTRGLVALVDDADVPLVSKFKWFCCGKPSYAGTTCEGRHSYMHRMIMAPPEGYVVDHINGDTLDNRRQNLRVCPKRLNHQNSRKYRTSGGDKTSSIYKGVHLRKDTGRWTAYIKAPEKMFWLGCYDDETEAARAYDTAAKQFFGPFARLNFPDQIEAPSNGSFFKPLEGSECETTCSATATMRAET